MRPLQAKRDLYRRKAREEGYRSRAAFKLIQLNRKFRLMKPGDRVLDIGCAPGGWLQVESEAVGQEGKVLGVDILPVEPPAANVETMTLDVTSPQAASEILEKMPGGVDAVFSDLSPKTIGVWEVDSARQIDMSAKALRVACQVLKRDGPAVFKVFQGELTDELLREAKGRFERVDLAKPEASRKESSELYLVCLGFKG
jgi:23S rRNA (uridine2552-2'-O)-methyltransferase